MNFNRSPFYVRQTHFLVIGIGLGLLIYIVFLRPRLIVLLSGGLIALVSLVFWFWQFRSKKAIHDANDLLSLSVFLERMSAIDRQIPLSDRSHWQLPYETAQAAYRSAVEIAQRQPVEIPELIETLHTVLDLAAQVKDAMQGLHHVQTPQYRAAVQQQLETSLLSLKQTVDRLQQWSDRLVMVQLESATPTLPDVL